MQYVIAAAITVSTVAAGLVSMLGDCGCGGCPL